MSPVLIEKVSFKSGERGSHQLVLKLTARNDFPSYAIHGYLLKTNNGSYAIPDMNPGESKEVTIPLSGFDKNISLTLMKPTGYSAGIKEIELK